MAEPYRPPPEPAAALQEWWRQDPDEDAAWRAATPGPALSAVAERLSSVPGEFLDPAVDLRALAGDVLGVAPALQEVCAAAQPTEDPRLGAAIALWLWSDLAALARPRTSAPGLDHRHAPASVRALALRLAPVVPPRRWLSDAERREEAGRLFLLWAGVRPAGEDVRTARARWDRLDSLTRDEALRSAVEDYRHRLEVQRALRERRAREAASRYTHE